MSLKCDGVMGDTGIWLLYIHVSVELLQKYRERGDLFEEFNKVFRGKEIMSYIKGDSELKALIFR